MSTGVIYARYSCDKQTENSILGQVRECKEFASKNGIEIIDVYKDEAISGRTATKRPAFMRMINDAHKHYFQNIIVWKGDRFSRSRADAAKYKSELKKLGVNVLSATEANVTGPEAVLMDGINEAFAEYFSVELAAKVERGMTQNCIDGKFNGGILPFGYMLDENRRIVIDESEAKIVKELFEKYANFDISISSIISDFTARGICRRNGKPLKRSAIHRMLSMRKYIGEYSFKGTVNNTMYPPIIDIETFKKVQGKLKINQDNRGAFSAHERYILRGKLFCGECLSLMVAAGGTSKSGKLRKYYRCSGARDGFCDMQSVDKYVIEDIVIEEIQRFLMKDDIIESCIKKLVTYGNVRTPEIDNIQKALADTNSKIKNYMLAFESGVNIDVAIERLKELQVIKAKQEQELKNQQLLNRTFTEDDYRNFFKHWKGMKCFDIDSKQYMINTFVSKVYIFKDKSIKILFNILYNDCPIEVTNSVLTTSPMVHQLKNNHRLVIFLLAPSM